MKPFLIAQAQVNSVKKGMAFTFPQNPSAT